MISMIYFSATFHFQQTFNIQEGDQQNNPASSAATAEAQPLCAAPKQFTVHWNLADFLDDRH